MLKRHLKSGRPEKLVGVLTDACVRNSTCLLSLVMVESTPLNFLMMCLRNTLYSHDK